jgi:hypothetical protein
MHDLSVLMRDLAGPGAPKQWLAAGAGALLGVIGAPRATLALVVTGWTGKLRNNCFNQRVLVHI